MPDWSYHTIFKPLLFQMPAQASRDLTLGVVSRLGSLPGGGLIIDFMGHMRPAPALSHRADGIVFPGRVGLGAGLEINGSALRAFDHFGFGFVELGPVTVQPIKGAAISRDLANKSLIYDEPLANEGLESMAGSLAEKPPLTPVFMRVAHGSGTTGSDAVAQLRLMCERLPAWLAALVVDIDNVSGSWTDSELSNYITELYLSKRRFLILIAPDTVEDSCRRLLSAVTDHSIHCHGTSLNYGNLFLGVSVGGGIKCGDGSQRKCGVPVRNSTLNMVAFLRDSLPDKLVIGSGGIIEPNDAIEVFEGGADMVALHSGLIFSGPGLAKRINELNFAMTTDFSSRRPSYSLGSIINCGWLGLAFCGAGLLITGSSAITVGLTTVVLPYDERYLGLPRAALSAINSHLLPFLSHDRVTYAGAGMSGGLMFICLSVFGARKGEHWAYVAARNSCAFGFASFLLFLGFHYLDVLHALVTLIMLPFFLWAVVRPPTCVPMRSSNRFNSAAWKSSLIGQFWFVGIGVGLILAGITICHVGTTTVFVHEDLMFMHTTAQQLLGHNSHLLPAIAHDRAGFGGALVTVGIAVLMTALHGYRQGEGWVWWMLLIAGLPGFVAALSIHFAIGYTNWFHLLPAYIACAMFIAGLAFSYQYLCEEPGVEALEKAPAGAR